LNRTGSRYGFLLILFLLAISFHSCKTDEEIGFGVQPPGDKIIIGFNEGSGITAYSIKEDSLRSDETILNLMGSTFDPVFGTSTAGFYAQFRLPDNNVNFGDNPVIDSVVLAIAYHSYYGDESTSQTVKVYEISDDFYKDSLYYTNIKLNTYASPLAEKLFFPRTTDSASADGVMYGPHLQVRLDDAFGQKFLDQSGTATLATNEAFQTFFKGLYITAVPVSFNGAIIYFNLFSTPTRLKLYYHNDAQDSLNYSFVINDKCARINTFDHYGYAGASHDFQHQIAGDTIRGNQKLYLQSMAGVKTFIRFPELGSLFDEEVVINKAELVIPIHPDDNGTYSRPSQLTLVKIESDGSLSFLIDELYGSAYFGGTYNGTTGEYRFNIATYVQNIILNADNAGKGLYLAISGSSIKGDRLVINGAANETNNLRLEITYTRIP
jgi:hypothetical protein